MKALLAICCDWRRHLDYAPGETLKVADVAGKGLASALIGTFRSAIRAMVHAGLGFRSLPHYGEADKTAICQGSA